MQPLASVEELEARLGAPFPSAPEHARAMAALEDASAVLRAECGRAEWDEVPETVRVLTLRVARRMLMNPDGLQSESIGPASASVSGEVAEGMLTVAERRMLRAGVGSHRSAMTVRTPSAYDGT